MERVEEMSERMISISDQRGDLETLHQLGRDRPTSPLVDAGGGWGGVGVKCRQGPANLSTLVDAGSWGGEVSGELVS